MSGVITALETLIHKMSINASETIPHSKQPADAETVSQISLPVTSALNSNHIKYMPVARSHSKEIALKPTASFTQQQTY